MGSKVLSCSLFHVIHDDPGGLSFVFPRWGNYGSDRISNLPNIPQPTTAELGLWDCSVFMPLPPASPDSYLQLGTNKHSGVGWGGWLEEARGSLLDITRLHPHMPILQLQFIFKSQLNVAFSRWFSLTPLSKLGAPLFYVPITSCSYLIILAVLMNF